MNHEPEREIVRAHNPFASQTVTASNWPPGGRRRSIMAETPLTVERRAGQAVARSATLRTIGTGLKRTPKEFLVSTRPA